MGSGMDIFAVFREGKWGVVDGQHNKHVPLEFETQKAAWDVYNKKFHKT
jgi:hypothetical protein